MFYFDKIRRLIRATCDLNHHSLSTEVLNTLFWQQWKDAYMTWRLEDYEGVGAISLDQSEVWMPDIMLYNT